MGTITTPIYGITAPDDLDPIKNGAAIMRTNAATIEAALKRGGIAPPAAQDLAALAGRVTTLEVDTGWFGWPSLAAGFTSSAGVGTFVRRIGKVVSIRAEVANTAGWTANKVLTQLDTTMRPSKAWWFLGVGYGGAAMPCYVDAAGQVIIANAAGANSGGWVSTTYFAG